MIAGYEDKPLVDGSRFLTDPLFWPTFLISTMSSDDPSRITAAFEVDEEDCLTFFRRWIDPEAWPVLRLGLPDGHEIDVVRWNNPGAGNDEYVLCRPGGQHPLDFAVLGGHELLPGLSWPELVTAANWSAASFGVVAPDARLLLLLPAYGDPDQPDEADAIVTKALMACGARARVHELGTWLVREPGGSPPWRHRDDGALVNAGRHSRRNPEGPAGHSAADLLEISSALAGG